jgi:hypothetical protein
MADSRWQRDKVPVPHSTARATELLAQAEQALSDGRLLSDDIKRKFIIQEQLMTEVLYGYETVPYRLQG